MKFIKWKSLLVTCAVCLLPIILGVAFFDSLPDRIAIHFDFQGTPDNFASKEFAVFALPVLMALLQVFCCFINDINAKKHGERIKFERATKWIIPIMTIVLQSATLGYALGWNLDIRKIVAFVVGAVFLVIGNFLPKLDYVKDYDVGTEKARNINRFIAYQSIIMGALFLISIFLPPITTLMCIILLIPYAVLNIIYGIKVGRK